MGKRLYVAKKYRIEYGSVENYNWKIDEFHHLLSALDIEYTGEESDDEFEVETNDFFNGLYLLKHLNEQDNEIQEEIKEAISELYGYDFSDELLEKCFKDLLAYYVECDHHNSFMHFQFL